MSIVNLLNQTLASMHVYSAVSTIKSRAIKRTRFAKDLFICYYINN